MDSFCKRHDQFLKDWDDLRKNHISFIHASNKLKETSAQCVKSVKHCRSYMKVLRNEINNLEKGSTESEREKLDAIKIDIQKKEYRLADIENGLPRSAGLYLRIVLGALNISFSNKEDKFRYKNDYEQFKIIVSAISAVLSFLLYFFIQSRILDTVFHALLVWYYCTLTIRERILIANGSRIKGWWNIYHFISTACAGIMLIWPRSQSYTEFRDQFMLFSMYLNLVHCIQYYYQVGILYKLRTLGCRHPMDITVDGFMSWMFRRLTFILPFLFGAYIFELYNGYRLYRISQEEYCHEWQVLAVSIIYFTLAWGNITTVCLVIKQKLRSPPPVVLRHHLSRKYSFAKPSDSDDGDSANEQLQKQQQAESGENNKDK